MATIRAPRVLPRKKDKNQQEQGPCPQATSGTPDESLCGPIGCDQGTEQAAHPGGRMPWFRASHLLMARPPARWRDSCPRQQQDDSPETVSGVLILAENAAGRSSAPSSSVPRFFRKDRCPVFLERMTMLPRSCRERNQNRCRVPRSPAHRAPRCCRPPLALLALHGLGDLLQSDVVLCKLGRINGSAETASSHPQNSSHRRHQSPALRRGNNDPFLKSLFNSRSSRKHDSSV